MELEGVIGLIATGVHFDETCRQWTFRFGDYCQIVVECPWRVVAQNRVAATDQDHRQCFGLTAPVDSEVRVLDLLRGRTITQAILADGTGDLRVAFDGGVALETFTHSSGYESGSIHLPNGKLIVLMGGGETAVFTKPSPTKSG